MRIIRTETRIHASAEEVWKQLTDFDSYRRWNPFIRISGKPERGERLKVELQVEGQTVAFRPVVVAAEPGRELRWAGRLPAPALVEGEHGFVIEPLEAGWVRLEHRGTFNGLLVPLFSSWFAGSLRLGFEQMNRALKIRAEQMEHCAERIRAADPAVIVLARSA